jgi:hypothetical protein
MDILLLIVISVLSRIVPHLPNMTAMGAVGLFAGSSYSLKKSLFIILSSLLVSDAVLGLHPVMWATYGSFGITMLLGRMLKKNHSWKFLGAMTFFSSLQFFIITNFAVWTTGLLYPKTITGLLDCYIMALPFFRNSLTGDLVYTFLFFGLSCCLTYIKQYKFSKDILICR